MHNQTHFSPVPALAFGLFLLASPAGAFEGRIAAAVTQGGQASGLLDIAGTNVLHIEKTDTNWPQARNLVDLQTGALTLPFPHYRSFVRLKPVAAGVSPAGEGGKQTNSTQAWITISAPAGNCFYRLHKP